jgi:2-polyprenyl-6-methoxyphenol hydroxylase-like FAD-dependent oxidoreductase
VQTGKRLLDAQQETGSVAARFSVDEGETQTVTGDVLIGCDGIRSALRRQLYPQPGADPLIYSGITMWRGVTRQQPFLSGATMAYAGWLSTGKVIAYPITPPDPHDGTQLINWLCEFYVPPRDASGDWSRAGRPADFLWACKEMTFDWLDIPGLVQAADYIYEYPMVDRNPLPRWSHGRLTLLGDAAHPMYPRGSNGAGQAIVDARALADALAASQDGPQALQHYDEVRRPATGKVVIANRMIPPDAILRAVYERTGDQPFEHIEDVISSAELTQLSQAYKEVAGFDKESLTAAAPQ